MKEKKNYKHLGELVKEYRTKCRMTQMELAQKLNYSIPQFISLIENGHSKIPLNILGELIVILKIPEKKALDILIKLYIEDIKAQIEVGKKKALSYS